MDLDLERWLTSGRGFFDSEVIEPSHGTPYVAADVVDRWAGVFAFSLGSKGDVYADGLLHYRTDAARWEEVSSGGGIYGSWPVPWSPPSDGWDGEPILQLGCSGCDFEGDDGEDVLVLVHVGFVRPDVVELEIEDIRGSRTVAVTSPVRGFAALTFGSDTTVMRCRNDVGAVLGESSYRPT